MTSTSVKIAAALVAGGALASASPALAGTATTSFQVTANVNSNCTIAAGDLAFGDYDPTGGDLDATSTIQLLCTSSAQWNLALNEGTYSGATVTTRKMTGPGTYSLNYGLYRNSLRTDNWGKTVGTDTLSGVGSGSTENVTVYGRIPGTQNVGAGGYVDTITATVSF